MQIHRNILQETLQRENSLTYTVTHPSQHSPTLLGFFPFQSTRPIREGSFFAWVTSNILKFFPISNYLFGFYVLLRMSTEFRRHGIPVVFCTSVSSVFRAKSPKIPLNSVSQNRTKFHGNPQISLSTCRGILRNFAEFCVWLKNIPYSAGSRKTSSLDALVLHG